MRIFMKKRTYWLLALLILAGWCAMPNDRDAFSDDIISVANSLIGTPYRPGGSSLEGFDCSGFTSYVHEQAGISIPRDSRSQAALGSKVSLDEVEPGDLIFFQGPDRASKSIGHVGIVTGGAGDSVEVIHACRRGVVKEAILSLRYYRDRFVTVRRL